ncbi:zinc ABC transporter substrate-binding protein ZnuA [Amphritea sp. HPY]|uniref:zinc ABC transporter substrate-binding protein ZnuA n=1 Tax=Amphritea sp. HPY TaxID=3421652 RepID=UPI003D7DF048
MLCQTPLILSATALRSVVICVCCIFSSLVLAQQNKPQEQTQEVPLQLLASIKPVQLIAESLLGDLAEVELLIPAGSSPHHFSLKPSAIRRMHAADLVLWAGADLERFLVKPVARLERPALALLMEDDEHVEQLAVNNTAEDEHQDHNSHSGHEHNHGHEGNPHFWMKPERVQLAAEKIVHELERRYPKMREQLERALADFNSRLTVADQQLQQQLQPLQDRGFFVFHDAFAGYVEHYGLKQLGYFTVDPGRKPGAKRLGQIRAALEQQQAVCVFVEPQFTAPVVSSLTRGLDIGVGTLDPMAIETTVGRDGYMDYLQQLADQFSACLAKNQKK